MAKRDTRLTAQPEPDLHKAGVVRRTKFQCSVCGKITAGRLPSAGRGDEGDGSFYFPRRHKGLDGKPCAGNIEEAIWITVS